jgi:CheY-like chemotaxis protein
VVVAGTALAALAKAAVRPPDVALVDIGLPDRDGCEVARALRNSLPPEIRLIAMSGYGQRHDGARALAAGFDEFLVKPLNTVRLRRLLGEAGPLSLTATSRDK